MTQAELGKLIGVSQARIAEIEANPGTVSFDQMTQLLSILGGTLMLHEDEHAFTRLVQPEENAKKARSKTPPREAEFKQPSEKVHFAGVPAFTFNVPMKEWRNYVVHQAEPYSAVTNVLASPPINDKNNSDDKPDENTPSHLQKQQIPSHHNKEVVPTSRRNLVPHPKKGSW